MNYFLMMIIVALCGGGYYEYTNFQQQIHDLGAKVDELQAANKALEDDNTRLMKSVNDAQTEIADLARQIQGAPSTPAEAKQQAPQSTQANTSAAATTATPPTNDLGTITTLTGKTFLNCQLLKVKVDGIVVSHSEGITEIVYGSLPPELQKKFGYDPHQAAALTEAQIQFQEEQRKAAADAAGH